jgi:N-acetylmuramoyl-L-alanine amidase
VSEYFLSREIIRETVKRMEKMQLGIELVVVEDSNNYREKITEVNKINPDLAVEIHWNACGSDKVCGGEAFVADNASGKSCVCAGLYVSILAEVSGIPTRGVKEEQESQYDSLAWCSGLRCPSVLVENEFLTYREFDPELYRSISVTTLMRFIAAVARRYAK